MKRVVSVVVVIMALTLAYVVHLPSEPSFNGTAPGCGPASGCHTFQSGLVSVTPLGNLQVRITLTGTTSRVGGELVDSAGTVVAVNNSTSSNPFTLTAPRSGRFTVNAGFDNPQRRWDSTRVVLSLTGIGDEGIETRASFVRLEQNYPNPFNPVTSIRFNLPNTRDVKLIVYDVRGKEVRTLLSGRLPAGDHHVPFDAGTLGSGIYFYRLTAGSFVASKQMLLLR